MTEANNLHDCCETCVGWQQRDTYSGKCNRSESLSCGTTTDSRYRCPTFKRKNGVDPRPSL